MKNEGIGSWIARRARMNPNKTAVCFEEQAYSYGLLDQRITRLAHALRALGVEHGDRVSYLGPNHPAFLETLFATGTLGAVFVPLNFRLTVPELVFNLTDSKSRVLVCGPEHAQLADSLKREADLEEVIVHGARAEGTRSYDDLLEQSATSPIDEPVSLDETCMILYTSGTTGRPKGAALTHSNKTWNCFNVLIDIDVLADEVSLVSAPLFHAAALSMLCLPTLLKGATAVLASSFSPSGAFDLIERHGVTWVFGVPAMFQAMASAPEWPDADLSSLRILMCGGAPVPESLIHKYQDRGLTFLQGYGMTEAAPGVLFLSREHAAKVGSAGTASFFVDVRRIAPNGEPVVGKEPGEILVRGPNVMSGYWSRPEANAEAFVDGDWFRSGDVAVVDDDGFFYIRDRIKDMIISGGENVYPAEVESAFLEDDRVAECAVIGVPDEKWGEVGKALVVLRAEAKIDGQALLEHVSSKLARFKIPKTVEFVSELPRTGSGKIDKVTLRARFGAGPPRTSPVESRQPAAKGGKVRA